jgi:hypothetical protein
MIGISFKPEMIEKIKSGEKIMTRRPYKPRYSVDETLYVKKSRFDSADKSDTKIAIIGVTLERLKAIRLDDVKREGFKTHEEFFAYWDHIYADRPELQSAQNPFVEVYLFERIEND